MLKCLIIDDEPLALRQLAAYIAKIPYLELVASCNNALKAQLVVATEPIDLIFVDINMPDLNGVDFVRSMTHNRPMIVFTTAYSEYAVEGFRLDAVDYLLKPFSLLDFSRAAAKAYSLYELRRLQQHPTPAPVPTEPTPAPVEEPAPPTEEEPKEEPKETEYISVKADYKTVLVKLQEIVYIESEGEYVRIHLADGRRITTLYRIKNMEAQLPTERFMRIHRSYIVNLQAITGYVRGRVYLGEKVDLPIGENYREAFQAYTEKL
ncbi:MAG: response regulator transcription factor [Alistipes sp.]|nr:response regulator transcription factor [Alistipes sp.]